MRLKTMAVFAFVGFAAPMAANASIYEYTYQGTANSEIPSPSVFGNPVTTANSPIYGEVTNVPFTAIYTVNTAKGSTFDFSGPGLFTYSSLGPGVGFGATNPIGLNLKIGAIDQNFDMNLPTANGQLSDTYYDGTLFGQYSYFQVGNHSQGVFLEADTGGTIGQPFSGGVILETSPNVESVIDFSSARLSVTDASAVPEPSTWALLIAGIGMLGLTLRYGRRRGSSITI